jgi:hypothetical protein
MVLRRLLNTNDVSTENGLQYKCVLVERPEHADDNISETPKLELPKIERCFSSKTTEIVVLTHLSPANIVIHVPSTQIEG